jgi:tetratricopeptide (TPR) repeat protein
MTRVASLDRASRFDSTLRTILLCVVIGGDLIVLFPAIFPSERVVSLQAIRSAVEAQSADVNVLIDTHLQRFSDDPSAVFIAGQLAAGDHHHQVAIEAFSRLPRDGGHWELQAELGIARQYRVTAGMVDEERHLRNVLRLDPVHADANHRIGHLLQVQGRTWESEAHFLMQIQRGKCRGDELIAVATTERFFRADERLDQAAKGVEGGNEIALLGDARRMLFENRSSEARSLLSRIVAELPELGEAQGRLGRIVVENGDFDEFIRWRGALPEAARQHPEVWYVQGVQARRIGQAEGAAYCFLQAIRLSPNHLPANAQIAGCLDSIGRKDASLVFKDRSKVLSELEGVFNLLRTSVDAELIFRASDGLGKLGRYWEAAGWQYVLTFLEETPPELYHPNRSQWAVLAPKDAQQNAGFRQLLDSLELADLHEPNWGVAETGREGHDDRDLNPSEISPERIDWQLTDRAAEVGISFKYYEGTTEETRLQHIFNVVGGGVGAIDFDLDGWPDLYLAQANDWRDPQLQPQYVDQLFRNRIGESFVDVTGIVGIVETGFSHGVTGGDFDQDGFPDIHVSNKGANRLFRNNGDGTFEDVSDFAAISGSGWTISSIFADLSGDGLPDLYVGNYSPITETETKECHRSPGVPMSCAPDLLVAESDRLYLNRGDGTFQDITDASGIRESSGRGLALVAWDFAGDGRLSLFVANDTSANFLYVNQGASPDGIPIFQEEGILRGLAFDADGNAQASMGIAAGDPNHDGLVELFVTNFAHESNTLYAQVERGSFIDMTRQYLLRDPSFGMLGFGTQFADLDGDGWEDLVAVNGHVDQSGDTSSTDRMRPQIFRNKQGNAFEEVSADSLGSYFQAGHLGRSLAVCDWNRDGKSDFAITRLHAPFSLISNLTPSPGKSLSIRLVAKSGTRDATGATIRARIDGKDVYRMFTAGDGYMSTNCNTVVFAGIQTTHVESIEVSWSKGLVQRWDLVPVHHEIILVEGVDAAFFAVHGGVD